jgi:hypothetical protein
MRQIMTILAVGSVFTGLALAETWTGKLIDATCYDQQKSAKGCDATGATAAFAIDVSGKVYRLDDAGKVATAIKSSADRAKDPAKPAAGAVQAKVTGSLNGESIKVEAVEVQ